MIRRFLALRPPRRRLMIYASALLTTARVLLVLLPFRTVRALFQADAGRAARASWTTDDVAWAIGTAAHMTGASGSCLAEALSAAALLAMAGIAGDLQFGAWRGPDGRPRAHAWVTVDGRAVIGGDRVAEAARLVAPGSTHA